MRQFIKHLTTENLEKAVSMDNMELRQLFGLKTGSEFAEVRILVEREYVSRKAA